MTDIAEKDESSNTEIWHSPYDKLPGLPARKVMTIVWGRKKPVIDQWDGTLFGSQRHGHVIEQWSEILKDK